MKNILCDGVQTSQFPRQQQLERVRQVIRQELTPIQKQTLLAYYFQEMSTVQIARERGVSRSTVSRTLKRAENRLKRYLQY